MENKLTQNRLICYYDTYEGQFLYSESYREIGRLSDSIDWECVHNAR